MLLMIQPSTPANDVLTLPTFVTTEPGRIEPCSLPPESEVSTIIVTSRYENVAHPVVSYGMGPTSPWTRMFTPTFGTRTCAWSPPFTSVTSTVWGPGRLRAL